MNNRKWVHLTFLLCGSFHSWMQRVSGFTISWQDKSLIINSTGSEWLSTFSVLWFVYVQPYQYLQIVKFQFSHCMAVLTLLPSRWAESMHEILITIPICILACMFTTQLIWWFHASLSSACTFLFVFSNCKIHLYLWCIINLNSDCMSTTKLHLIASHFPNRGLNSLFLEQQPNSQPL